MKLIPLTQGKFAQIDDEDFEKINKHKWCLKTSKCSNIIYAKTTKWNPCIKKQKFFYMHHLIMNPFKGNFIDHIDHDGLNNQKNNLRTCTPQQNSRNQRSKRKATSKYLGVCLKINKKNNKIYFKKWHAQIGIDYKQINLGYFNTENEAALAYNKKALELFGEFANINII